MSRPGIQERLPFFMFILSLCVISFMYGFFSYHSKIFPYNQIKKIGKDIKSLMAKKWYYVPADENEFISVNKPGAWQSPTLIMSIDKDYALVAKIIDINGNILHQWDLNWFKIWPDATHIPEDKIPRSKPGTIIHGAVLLDDGSLVFNYENLGLVRINTCGEVVWKLARFTHHSVWRDDETGILWVCGELYHNEPLENYPNFIPPFVESTILKVSEDGEILDELSVFDLLYDNHLEGLLYNSTINDLNTRVSGDIMHLNDIEAFPSGMDEGYFKHGDVMISLRNINAVVFYDDHNKKVKNVTIGSFVRQHDPDFIDGNTISIFDNYNTGSKQKGRQSRILIKSFDQDTSWVYYAGSEENPFNTNILGKHQWLPNRHLLITEARKGRAYEVDEQGTIYWQYNNLVGDGKAGAVFEATRLPVKFSREFFEQKVKECQNSL